MPTPLRDTTTEAMSYLTSGGLGEVFGMADMAMRLGQPKVQMDTDMAIALCRLANDGLLANEGPQARSGAGSHH